jgi:coenzyme F420-reducing hydrogenase gamma subunit
VDGEKEFKYCKFIKGKNNDFTNSGVAFVEGAIATKEQEELLKQIRQNCKRLVA